MLLQLHSQCLARLTVEILTVILKGKEISKTGQWRGCGRINRQMTAKIQTGKNSSFYKAFNDEYNRNSIKKIVLIDYQYRINFVFLECPIKEKWAWQRLWNKPTSIGTNHTPHA